MLLVVVRQMYFSGLIKHLVLTSFTSSTLLSWQLRHGNCSFRKSRTTKYQLHKSSRLESSFRIKSQSLLFYYAHSMTHMLRFPWSQHFAWARQVFLKLHTSIRTIFPKMRLSQAKVHHIDLVPGLPPANHKIGWFDVSMYISAVVNLFNCVQHLVLY